MGPEIPHGRTTISSRIKVSKDVFVTYCARIHAAQSPNTFIELTDVSYPISCQQIPVIDKSSHDAKPGISLDVYIVPRCNCLVTAVFIMPQNTKFYSFLPWQALFRIQLQL